MSLIGRRPLVIPPNVTVSFLPNFRSITVTGPKGTITKKLSGRIAIDQKENRLTTQLMPKPAKEDKALWGTTNSIIANLLAGVTKEFTKKLLISGLGYKALLKDQQLELHLGFSHAIFLTIPQGVKIVVPKPTTIEISGIDKELVGLFASQIRKLKKTEPYKGKGVRYVDEVPLRKAGKTTTSK